jgi:fatty-acyl-CoA synthase
MVRLRHVGDRANRHAVPDYREELARGLGCRPYDIAHDGTSVGEVVLRAPWLTMAYCGDPNASAELWRGGYMHTQDAASIDGEGNLQITDRMKDVIKSGGEWVSSLLLEDLISRHPHVAEVAVLGIKDERWGERPMAFVVAKPAFLDVCTPASIRQHMQAYVAQGDINKHDVPDRIDMVAAIEKTSVGKLNKKLMREQLAARDNKK